MYFDVCLVLAHRKSQFSPGYGCSERSSASILGAESDPAACSMQCVRCNRTTEHERHRSYQAGECIFACIALVLDVVR